MKRLIAFGCSLTYGHGLADCYVDPHYPGPVASKLVWPEIVAQHLNRTCINMATPGSSNKRIWHNIVNFKFKKDDIVIILWSYQERFAILKNKDVVEDVGRWMESDTPRAYYQHLHTEYDSLMQTKLYVSHANFILKDKAIPVYNLTVEKETTSIFKLPGHRVSHIPLYIWDNYRNKYPVAMDGTHPGVECNQVFAKDVLRYIVPSTRRKFNNLIERIKCMLT